MKRIAIFPGSFDPFTIGHENIVRRGLKLFDKIIIGVGYNSEKRYFFSVEKRVNFIAEEFKNEPRIEVAQYCNLTVDFAIEKKAEFILRGIRTTIDFEYEKALAHVNSLLKPVETVFLLTEPQHSHINSSTVRDILRHNGDVSMFLTPSIYNLIMNEKVKK